MPKREVMWCGVWRFCETHTTLDQNINLLRLLRLLRLLSLLSLLRLYTNLLP